MSIDPEVAEIALAEIMESLSGSERTVSDLLAAQEQARASCKDRLGKLAEMWLSGMMSDRERYRELEARELEALNGLASGIERTRDELGRMTLNARRARDFAAFSRDGFLVASPDRQRAIARALGARLAFYGVEKRIEIDPDPILLEFARFASSETGSLEPSVRGSKKRKTSVFREDACSWWTCL